MRRQRWVGKVELLPVLNGCRRQLALTLTTRAGDQTVARRVDAPLA